MRRALLLVTRERGVVLVLVVVLMAGGWLRLSGSDWDEGYHLHPDERYLQSLSDNLRWPNSLGEYLDVGTSPLSPYNVEQGVDLVYGTLPIFADKAVAAVLGRDDYGESYLVGRRVAAIVDLGTIVLVFLLARLLLGSSGRRAALWGGVLAAAFYAFTVTAIQHAHFATVDTWLVFFGTLTVYLAGRALLRPIASIGQLELAWIAVGAAAGLTVACKVSGALVLVPVAVALLGRAGAAARVVGPSAAAAGLGAWSLAATLAGYLAYRSVSPYTFASSLWLDVSVNPHLRDALTRQREALEGVSLPPPSYQWLLSTRVWDPLENLVVWQLGVPLGVAALVGGVVLAACVVRPIVKLVRTRAWAGASPRLIQELTLYTMVLLFVVVVLLRFSTLFAHTGRYLLPLAPILAAVAAFGIVTLLRPHRYALVAVATATVGVTALYALAFHAVYRDTTTRVAASRWIVGNVPPGSGIANEHWDDSLPVGGDAQRYHGAIVPVYDPDDETKLRKLHEALETSDYYFLSSPRAWRSIGRLPDRYPLMVRFYDNLFAGRLGFEEVASFRAAPRLAGVELDDLDAEEAFWVYDHAPVRVFRHTRPLTFDEFRAVLCAPPAPAACS